jgi:hypothetical protein
MNIKKYRVGVQYLKGAYPEKRTILGILSSTDYIEVNDLFLE